MLILPLGLRAEVAKLFGRRHCWKVLCGCGGDSGRTNWIRNCFSVWNEGTISETTPSLSRRPGIELQRTKLNSIMAKYPLSLCFCCHTEEMRWEWSKKMNDYFPRHCGEEAVERWQQQTVESSQFTASGQTIPEPFMRPRRHMGQPLGNRKFRKGRRNRMEIGILNDLVIGSKWGCN